MKSPSYLRTLAKGGTIWETLRNVQDNWQNVITGLGTARDKTVYGGFVRLQEVTDSELTAMYHQNDTAQKIVALKPQEMMRKGYVVNVEDNTEASSKISKSLRSLRANQKIRDAMIWGRLYGGSVIYIGADDGKESFEPLDETKIKTVSFLEVIDKRYLVPDLWFSDPMNEHFGEPQTWRVVGKYGQTDSKIHTSRLLFFGGAHTTEEERDRLGQWDHSVITPVYGVLRQFDNVWQASEQLMADASQAVFKIRGLMSMLAGGQKEELQTRMQLVDMCRSVARAVLLDADGGEEFTREPSSFTDAATMLEKFMMRLASASDIPVTILMGRSPAGENATGDADFRWFYDTIKTAQENDLKPELEKLVRIFMLAQDGPTGGVEPEVWEIKFNELWQPTPSEQAELEKKVAEKDKIYLDADVLLPEEVALSRFRAEGWSAETTIDRDLREVSLKAEPVEVEPIEPTEGKPTTEPDVGSVDLGFSPTDTATFTTVNEARASKMLAKWPIAEEGLMTVAAFKQLKEAEGAAVGVAEGKVQAKEIAPASPAPPAFGGAPAPLAFGAPPAVDPEEDEDE